jgi:hypothetical protein
MRKFVTAIVTLVICLVLHVALTGQERISPTEASKYVGKPAIVCGQVASATFAAGSRGRPTFLNLDRPYPTQIFTALIWGENRANFTSPPEKAYSGKKICVRGTVSSYHGQPQIVVSDPSQIAAE